MYPKYDSTEYVKIDGKPAEILWYKKVRFRDPVKERAALDEAYNNTVASLEADEVEIARL